MCRLFGIHAINKIPVNQSLVTADNALINQSQVHQDGWGVAYYVRGVPHLIKSLGSAHSSNGFRQIAKNLETHTMVAHLRRATQGEISLVNCHPFQFGHWVMAHNGDCPSFSQIRQELLASAHPEFLSNVFGTTDSELYFALILTELNRLDLIDKKEPPIHS